MIDVQISDLFRRPIKLWKTAACSAFTCDFFGTATKQEKIVSHNEIAGITVWKMKKLLCRFAGFCFRAAKMSHLPIPINVTCIVTDAEEVD